MAAQLPCRLGRAADDHIVAIGVEGLAHPVFEAAEVRPERGNHAAGRSRCGSSEVRWANRTGQDGDGQGQALEDLPI